MKDIVIIGAGLSGITLANQLIEMYNVTIIERGPKVGITYPEQTFIHRKFGSSNTYCYGTGGTTHLWHNGLIPIKHEELEDGMFARILNSCSDKIDQAASLLNFKGEYLKEYNHSLDNYNKIASELTLDAELDTILIPNHNPLLKPRSNIKVINSCRVISGKYQSERLVSVQLKYGNGTEETLAADFFVICSGGISSPKVINTLLPDDLKEKKSKCLIDHPMGFLGKIKVKNKYKKSFDQFVNKDFGAYTGRCGIVIRNNNLKHICYFRPAATMSNKLGLYQFKSKLGTSNLLGKIKCLLDPKIFHPDIMSEIFLHVTGKNLSTRTYSVWFVFEQKKNKSNDNYVCLDEKELNKISWSLSEFENQSYVEAINYIEEKLTHYCDKVDFVKDNIDSYVWSAAHHSGTIEFGCEPGTIGIDFKVNGTDNLYVCDASIINEHGYTNTGLTISQLTIKLSEHLKAIG
ncbi:GMC oxidoreductase [Photobacterium arenosum]|uniref:GMC oxidoreductase n=1 Tax=Photobacterium arenosum TaxID=2774143 RepID=UPI0028894E15|nr:GMC oxidoreductase [Photobacterium arenosum]